MLKKIGVLALQGAFALHRSHVEALGGEYYEVLKQQDFDSIDALILPGGESATMLKLLEASDLKKVLAEFSTEKPTWGICAGAILLARSVSNPQQESFSTIDVDIVRNSYGRQVDSKFEEFNGYRVAYIRAPRICRVGTEVRVLAQSGTDPTWVECRNVMLTTFHPETNSKAPSPWHQRLASGLYY
jgi:5'-phosphate synthase pdxT subunit